MREVVLKLFFPITTPIIADNNALHRTRTSSPFLVFIIAHNSIILSLSNAVHGTERRALRYWRHEVALVIV